MHWGIWVLVAILWFNAFLGVAGALAAAILDVDAGAGLTGMVGLVIVLLLWPPAAFLLRRHAGWAGWLYAISMLMAWWVAPAGGAMAEVWAACAALMAILALARWHQQRQVRPARSQA